MNVEAEETGKRPLISLPFIIIVGILAIAGYAAGPWLMTQFMLMEEKQKASKIEEPEEFAELSELAKSLKEDPNASWEGMAVGPGGGGGGFDPAAVFTQMDANEDGQISGDEISGRLAENLTEIDSNGDGSVSQEEFMAAVGGGDDAPSQDTDDESDTSGGSN
ncbi:MAG: hypothetical protein NXI32_06660 [bacterium]|nr:hypothetical protein [bacterium]